MPSKQVTIQGVMNWDDPGVNVPVFPTHPIAPGGPPPGYWGGVAPPLPTHPIAPGGPPPTVWPGPGYPVHPIAPGGPPPGYWGGVAPPLPDQGLPGVPPGFWGGVAPPLPTHPIAPGGPPPGAGWVPPGTGPSHPIAGGGYVVGWSPTYGFVFIPLGGAQPPATGGETPTHPIAGTDTKPDQGLP